MEPWVGRSGPRGERAERFLFKVQRIGWGEARDGAMGGEGPFFKVS